MKPQHESYLSVGGMIEMNTNPVTSFIRMNLLAGIDLHCPLLQAAIALLVIGFLTVISLLKFYAYITCGRCNSDRKMKGKTVIVTGATGGIGKETAKDLAARGARVILACRNTDYGNQIKDEFVKETQNENIVVKKLDLSSQKSIREFAKDINQTESRLDVLIHNAGTAELRSKTTEDGLELTMATNHFGPFLLTHLLIDLLKRSAPSRIVVVASALYRFASVNLNKLNPVDSFCPGYIYYVSKYVNIYFTEELARRLEEQGCQTSVYAAVSEEIEGVTGKYFIDCKEGTLSNAARDMAKAKKVWEVSEKLVNLQPDDPKI
ncbi:short chain dehydrogenase [Popillia japonica]|uniref:Short chain dehydrogenase n=1 Tax=Popillia japonica TaxID=7064 RepID=A0AAW1N234_POPJA